MGIGDIRIAPYKLRYTIIHYVFGLVAGLSDPFLLFAMLITFLIYEIVEMQRLHDNAYYEIREFGAGLFTSAVIKLILTYYPLGFCLI